MRALAEPDDYPPEVFTIIRQEAARRSLGNAENCARHDPAVPPLGFLTKRVWAFLIEHRLVVAGLAGASFPVGRILRDWCSIGVSLAMEFVVLASVCLLGLAVGCWPLHDYRLAVRATFVAAVVFSTIGTLNGIVRDRGGMSIFPWVFPLGTISALLLVWGTACGILCGLMYVRNSLWPIYPAGHCTACGYNLFGLTSGRCPECGTPVERQGTAESEVQSKE